MGVISQHIDATRSPLPALLRSPQQQVRGSPLVIAKPGLVDEMAQDDLDFLSPLPPAVADEGPEEQPQQAKPSATTPWWAAPTLPQPDTYEKHTFVNVVVEGDDVQEPMYTGRARGVSDFTGLLELKARGIEYGMWGNEDWDSMLPSSAEGECYGETYGVEGGKQDDQAWYYGCTNGPMGAMCLPQSQSDSWDEDDMDDYSSALSGDRYVPKWFYGPRWPFNCAPTTLTLGNIPPMLSQEEVIAVLNSMGFRGKYDFVHTPRSFATGKNCGYATVNFTRHCHGLAFAARIHGFTDWSQGDGEQACSAEWAVPMQGWWEHVEYYRNHQVMHESVPECFRPVVYENGRKVAMPPPTKYIREPTLGRR